MVSIKRLFSVCFCILAIPVFLSCNSGPVGDGAYLAFYPTTCEQIHVSAKCDKKLTIWVKATGSDADHDDLIEGIVSDYYSKNYGISGGSCIREFFYCLEVCTSIVIVADIECNGVEPFNDLSDFFTVSATSDYYGGELLITSDSVIGRLNSIPLTKFIEYRPLMVPVMTFDMIAGDTDYTGAHFNITITLDNGNTFTKTVEIP